MKNFEEETMEYVKEIAYMSYELVEAAEKPVEKVYSFGSYENYSWERGVFFKSEGKKHGNEYLGISDDTVSGYFWAIMKPMRRILNLFEKNGQKKPITIRVITDLQAGTVDVRFGYEKGPTARQIAKGINPPFWAWVERVENGEEW